MTETALDALALALDDALAYDPNVATDPIALLWPDKERQWESVVPSCSHNGGSSPTGSSILSAGTARPTGCAA